MRPSSKIAPISSRVITGLVALSDSAVIVISGLVLYFSMVSSNLNDDYVVAISFIWLCALMLFQFTGLYQFDSIMRPWAVADKLLIANITAFLFFFAITFALKVSDFYSRLWVGSFAMACISFGILSRFIIAVFIEKLSELQIFTRNTIIAGEGKQTGLILQRIGSGQIRFVSLDGIFTDRPESIAACEKDKIIGGMQDLIPYTRKHDVDDIFLAMPWSADEEILTIVEKLRELPTNVYLISDLAGFRLNLREPPGHFDALPIRQILGRPISGWDIVSKTVFDYLLAVIAVIVLAPLLLMVAIAIKIDSPGDILFKQRRLGFNNREFTIYKFRSMHQDSGSEKKTVQAKKNDPRTTRIGWFLRRTSIDELPQLINVLNGSMSLVGPRPHAIDHNEDYAQRIRGYFTRHKVKPGITGWAQVNGFRGQTDTLEKMERRVEYDIYYTDNWSLMFDFRIIIRTIFICIVGSNAY